MSKQMLVTAALLAAFPALLYCQNTGSVELPSWLSGCWETGSGDRSTMEMWMPPAGGMMLGAARSVRGDVVTGFEALRLTVGEDGFVYTADPSGQAPASFHSTAVTDTSFTVENPEHDFPQRIKYVRVGADSVVARVEADGDNGPEGFYIRMARVPCVR